MSSEKETLRIPSYFIAKALRNEAVYQRQSWWLIALIPLWITVFVLVYLHHHDYDSSSSSSSFSTNDMKTILENQQLLQLRRLQYLKATTTTSNSDDEYYLSRIFFPTLAGLKHECRVTNSTTVTVECTSGTSSSSKWIQSSFDFLNSSFSSSSASSSGSVIVFFPSQQQQKAQHRHSSSLLNFLSEETPAKEKQEESLCSQLVASSPSTVSSSTTSSSLEFIRELTKTSFIIFEKCSSFYAIGSNTKLHVLLNMRRDEQQNDDEFLYLITVSSQNKKKSLSVKRVRINDKSLEASLIVAAICVLVFSVPLWIRIIKKISRNFSLIKQNEEIGDNDAKKKEEEEEVSQQTDQEQKQSSNYCSFLKQLVSAFVDFGVLSDLGIGVALLVFVGMTFARTSLMMNNNDYNSRNFFDDLHALEHDFIPTLGGLLVLASGFRTFFDLHLLPIDHLLRTFRFSRKLLVLGAFLSCIWILLSFTIALFVGFSNSVGVRHQTPFSFSRNFLQTLTAVFSLSTVGGNFPGDDNLFALQDHMSPFLVKLSVWLISGIVRFVVYSIFLAIFVDALISSPFRQIDANGEWLHKRVWCRMSTLWWVSKNEENHEEDDQERETDISPLSYWKKVWVTDFFIFLKRKCEQIINTCSRSGTNREPRNESSLYFPEILEREARELEDGVDKKRNNSKNKQSDIKTETTIRPLLSKTEYCHCSCSTSLECCCCWWREFIFEQAVADREHEMLEEEAYGERFGSPLDRIVKVVMKTQSKKE